MIKLTLAFTFLVAAFYAAPIQAQQATRADFNEYKTMMLGRWVGEVTWMADWPGLGKKGDKVTCYSELTATDDGQGILNKFYGGKGSSTSITIYDAAAKQIKETSVDSGGSVYVNLYFKESGKWVCVSTGSLGDGTKVESKSMVAITDNGNTQTWTGTATVGGKPTDDQHDVWRRASSK